MTAKPLTPKMPRLVTAKVIEELPHTEKLQSPSGKKLVAPKDQRTATIAAQDGRSASVDWDRQSLFAKDRKSGAKVTLVPPDNKGFGEMKDALKEAVDDAAGDPDASFPLGYSSYNEFKGVGTAGKLASVWELQSDYEGGMHPMNGHQYQTYDTRTGNRVKLSELLSPEQLDTVATQVATKMNEIDPDHMGGFEPMPENEQGNKPVPSDWKKAIDSNFALAAAGDKIYLRVGLPSDFHVMGTTSAYYSFELPQDPALMAKLGL